VHHFHVQVDAVEQGAGYFGDVAFHHTGAADAVFFGVVVVAAWAGAQNYLNEFCYKLNRRNFESEMFDRIITAGVDDVWYKNKAQYYR